MTCSTIGYRDWITESLNHIGAAIYILTVEAIETDLEADPSAELLGPFTTDYAGVNDVRVCKMIYLLAPFVGMFHDK